MSKYTAKDGKMKHTWLKFFYPILSFILMVALSCENPLKEEKKKEEVLRFIDDYFESGRYTQFWDGKNNKKEWISPGKYIYVMEARDFSDQYFMTAESGGTGKLKDSTSFEPGAWYTFELWQNSPEPFKIRDGTNIRFQVPVGSPTRVRITIYKD